MAKRYYTLVEFVRNVDGSAAWTPQFGAYDRDDVEAEKDDMDAWRAKCPKATLFTVARSITVAKHYV